MTERKGSQKGFVAVTLITILAIALVLIVYATFLGSFQGGEVTVGGVGGAQIKYSFNNNNESGPWTLTLNPSSVSTSWYARMNITAGDYSGPVNITWQLQKETGTDTWTNQGTPEYTPVVLTGSAGGQIIYVSSDGTFAAGNYNWKQKYTTAGTYRINATINSA